VARASSFTTKQKSLLSQPNQNTKKEKKNAKFSEREEDLTKTKNAEAWAI
jgi:hypothetical protein